MIPYENLLNEAQHLFSYTRQLRRDIHQHPELGFQEFRTAEVVAKELRDCGMMVTTGVATTGVVGLLEGTRSSPVILLRFDMDALPIQEENNCEYVSKNAGVMHACGHDGHVAVGLTVARILAQHRSEFPGQVKFIFQPAEEGIGGAEKMIAEGVLENPSPDFALAFHVWNHAPLGWLGLAPGAVMAAVDDFSITLTGKGGHGAMPEQAIDPIIAAAHVIAALQTVVARNVSPLLPAVISVTQMQAGSAFNVIPQSAELRGTIRTFEPDVRQTVLRRFEEVVRGVAGAMGCGCEIQVRSLAPALVNAPAVTEKVTGIARQLFTDGKIDSSFRTMGAEDMSFFLERVPGCFVFVGSASEEKGLHHPHHHPRFDFDEQALVVGTAVLTASALELLKEGG
ncbi:MAG: amidohydrolase [Anaerolineae bacterium]|nr:amidohydrolase [Anaerolineae bacterium]